MAEEDEQEWAATENRILVLATVCGVEKHAIKLNKSPSLISSFFFVKWKLILYHIEEHGSCNDGV